MTDGVRTYAGALRENVAGYEGEHAGIVRYAPALYVFFLNLLDDPRFPARLRRRACAAIAYFVAPADVLPEEEMGPAGYVDDVFLSAHVAQRIAEELEDETLLERAWEADEPLTPLVGDLLAETEEVLDETTRKRILRYVGVEGE